MATPVLRAIREDFVRDIGIDLPYATSCDFNWSGVEVHRYRLPPGETAEHAYPRLAILLGHTTVPLNGEAVVAGKRLRATIGPETVSIAAPGVPVSGRCDGAFEVTAIFLDPLAIADIARGETGSDLPEIRPQFAINDPVLRSLGTMLDAELFSDCRHSRVYAESLAAALAAQVFGRYSNRLSGLRVETLNKTQLRRSIDYIHANLHRDLTLTEIASVANMSKYHFAKSFRQMAGVAPHQYLVKLRIEKARKMLAHDTVSVEEIASRVGYTDKGNFSRQFLKIVGVSPSRYRLGI